MPFRVLPLMVATQPVLLGWVLGDITYTDRRELAERLEGGVTPFLFFDEPQSRTAVYTLPNGGFLPVYGQLSAQFQRLTQCSPTFRKWRDNLKQMEV